MPAVAVTDRNNLFGALEFSQYASKAGIQPIVGVDLAIAARKRAAWPRPASCRPSTG